ncbi:hypothetical protein BH23GEM5_BH23GEM5_29740 [soil metagenome]|jgi:hypothetical protein
MASSQDLLRRMLRSDYAQLPVPERLAILVTHIIEKYRGEREASLEDIAFFSGCSETEPQAVMDALVQKGFVRRTATGTYIVEAP